MGLRDRILILDDNIARHRLFRAIYGEREALHVHDVQRFQQQLEELRGETDPLAVVFLDHDLIPVHYRGAHNAECGCAAVEALNVFFVGVPMEKRPKVVIHSRNNAAGILMTQALMAGGFSKIAYTPFE